MAHAREQHQSFSIVDYTASSRRSQWVLFLIVFLILALAGNASAQTRPFVGGGLDVANSLGYLPGIPYATVGVEQQSKHFILVSSSSGALARKVETRDGVKASAFSEAYLRKGALLVGGGVSWVRQYTSVWTKGSTRPQVAIGIDTNYFRAISRYTFTGTDRRNDSSDLGLDLGFKVGPRWMIEQRMRIVRFCYTDVPTDRYVGITMGYGVRYYFRDRRSREVHVAQSNDEGTTKAGSRQETPNNPGLGQP
jgi:hypothetical protein